VLVEPEGRLGWGCWGAAFMPGTWRPASLDAGSPSGSRRLGRACSRAPWRSQQHCRFGSVLTQPLGILPTGPSWAESFRARPISTWDGSLRGTFHFASALLQLAGVTLTSSRVADYRPPSWPEDTIPKQVHLDSWWSAA